MQGGPVSARRLAAFAVVVLGVAVVGFLLGILAAFVGGALVIGLAEPLSLNLSPGLLWASLLVLSPLLGTIGFHLKRASREASTE